MATALVSTPAINGNPLRSCSSWRKCSTGSAKLVDVVLPAQGVLVNDTQAWLAPGLSEYDYKYDGLDEEEDGFSMDMLTERAVDMEDHYSAPAYKARNNFASKSKKAGLQAPQAKPDHSRHPLRYTHTKEHTAEEMHDKQHDWGNINFDYPSWINVDWKRPLAQVQEQIATYRMLYKSPRRNRQALSTNGGSCSVCYEEFGWHLTEHHKVVPGITYAAALRMRPDRAKLTWTARHRKCGEQICYICVQCFQRDLSRQLSSNRLFATRYGRQPLPTVVCSSCRHRYQNDELHSVLTPQQTEVLSERLLRHALHSAPDISFCPGANCPSAVAFDLKAPCTLLACPTCPMYWCFVCRGPYHWGRTCKEALAQDTNAVWRSKNTKPCPSCHTQIEKDKGCNHMHCEICNTDFSWSDVKFGEFSPLASSYRVNLPPRRINDKEFSTRLFLQLFEAQTRFGADDEIPDDDPIEDPVEGDDEPGDFSVSAKPKWKQHHDDASKRNLRHMAARAHRRLVDRFPQLHPLLQVAVSV